MRKESRRLRPAEGFHWKSRRAGCGPLTHWDVSRSSPVPCAQQVSGRFVCYDAALRHLASCVVSRLPSWAWSRGGHEVDPSPSLWSPKGLLSAECSAPGLKAGQELVSFLGQVLGCCLAAGGTGRVGPAASVVTEMHGFNSP